MNNVEMMVVSFLSVTIAFFVFIFIGRIKKNKVTNMQAQVDYNDKKSRYDVMTSELFDGIDDSELTHAILFNLLNKEDKIYEADVIDKTMIDVLNKQQLIMYTAYMVERSVEGGKGSIHSFFVDDNFKMFTPYLVTTFEELECFEVAELLSSAKQLADAIENDLDDIVIEGDYENYNFADYTSQFMSMIKSSNLVEKAVQYIRKNKESFIDKEEV